MREDETSGDARDEDTPGEPDELVGALRRLTNDLGIRSTGLHRDLGHDLRRIFHVPVSDTDRLRTQARVQWQLERLIASCLPSERLQTVARISYNIGIAEVRDLKLIGRRSWLSHVKDMPRESQSQRDLRDVIVPAFAASLRAAPPPEAPPDELAAIMAAESGLPADSFRSFRVGSAAIDTTTRPPAPSVRPLQWLVGGLVVAALVLAIVASGTPMMSAGDPPVTTATVTVGPPPSLATVTEIGGNRNGSPTFRDPRHPAETGPRVPFRAVVTVSCKLQAFSFDSIGPDGYWYLIASAPWNNQYYAPADTFLNGDPVDGPYEHNFDPAVPDCR